MKMFSKIFVIALIALASCRSIPRDIHTAHMTTVTESAAAFETAEGLLVLLENKDETLSSELVTDQYMIWRKHYMATVRARIDVLTYLQDEHGELTKPYIVGNRLLSDLNKNVIIIQSMWAKIILEENDALRVEFIAYLREDISRYLVLHRKFDDWFKQFSVKG